MEGAENIMSEERKSKAELLQELDALRFRISKLEQVEQALRESENKYRDLIEEMTDVIYTLDTEGNVTSVNKAGKTTFGREPEEVLGKSFTKWIPQEHLPDATAAFKRILSGEKITTETVMLDKQGRPHNVEFSSSPIIKDGKVVGTRGIIRDITERKKAEELLKQAKEHAENLLEAITESVVITGLDGRIQQVNSAFERGTGWKRQELIGKTVVELGIMSEEEGQRIQNEIIPKLINEGTVRDFESIAIKRSGTKIHVLINWTLLKNANGKPNSVITVSRNITKRKQIEKELKESEQRFRSIFDNAADGILLTDVESKKFYIGNKMICQMLGYTPEEFKKLAVADIHPKQDLPYVQEQFEGQVRGQFTLSKDIPVKRKDGSVFFADINSFPITLSDKTYLMGIFRDITERKKAEERIQALSSAIEQSIDGISIADLEPRLLYVNKAYAKMHGYTSEEMVGMPAVKLQSSEQTFKSDISRLKIDGAGEAEVRHIKKDGTPVSIYLSATLLKDANGQPTGILTIARDITDLKQREKEFDDYRQKMARSEQLASLGTLGAGLAHELTQPLTVITLLIENALMELEKAPCPGTIANKLKDVLAEVSKVTSITKKFRSAVRKSSERVVRQVDLKAVAQRTIELFDESARRAKITLDIMGLDKLPNIYSSEEEIEQLFFALVENAIHAADNEKGCRFIICGTVKDNYVELQFSDNGSGIAPENLNKIFEPFFTTKPIGAATGLGLCIAEHIVSRAGGKIHVESKLGEGTTFYVTLPIKRHAKLYPK
jgi:PAS domain S-box-containing protein